MPTFSGPTKQALVQLLDAAATHSIIENLFLRFEVDPITETGANKLRKATALVQTLSERGDGSALQDLITYVGSPHANMPQFHRGIAASDDLYRNYDRDLAASSPTPTRPSTHRTPPRQFTRPGTSASTSFTPNPAVGGGNRYVFVVRGRDADAYNALEAFLTSLDLRIVTWDDAVRGTGHGSPHTLDVVRAGIDMSDAVVVLMTPDDLGKVKPEFNDIRDTAAEAQLSGQARQNVVFEAGWAMALNQERVILVRVGDVRPLSDIDGLNYVWMTDDISSRRTLIGRLKNCGLAVIDTGEGWRSAGTFPDHV
ncbi:TIR domain-containing protein [Arthrobacter sp. SX1312]|uniref:TIR domain-containing protein n=1 Tax=Arthrobacter sp. SX1312 TaxID=2058896 RepID=UPI000CE48E26|nr:nucleotide-binding protein [Arthrobacter sp. SX1312]